MSGIGNAISGGIGLFSNLFGSGGENTPAQNVNVPQYTSGATGLAGGQVLQGSQDMVGRNLGTQTLPMAWQTAQNLYNNPFAPGLLDTSQAVAQLGQQGANNQFNYGLQLANQYGPQAFGQAPGLFNNAQTLFNLGMDPQNALYNRTRQQVQDQTRAGEAARGIAMTPYGAGLENDAMRNFNIDWQNNLLQRALAGAQGGAGQIQSGLGALGAGAGLTQMGAGLQQQAPGSYFAASSLPYSTFGNIGQNQFGALGGAQNIAQGGQQLQQQPLANFLQYLQLANQAGNVGVNQANAYYNQQQQNAKNMGANINNLFGGMGSFPGAYGGMGGGGNNPFLNLGSQMMF